MNEVDDPPLARHDELLILAVTLAVDAVGEEGVKENALLVLFDQGDGRTGVCALNGDRS